MTAEDGQRFETVLAGIEARGEEAEASPPDRGLDPYCCADFRDLSSLSGAETMAELRLRRRKPRA